jgi:hypothetical protein
MVFHVLAHHIPPVHHFPPHKVHFQVHFNPPLQVTFPAHPMYLAAPAPCTTRTLERQRQSKPVAFSDMTYSHTTGCGLSSGMGAAMGFQGL